MDAEELQQDEYLVDELMAHRGDGASRQFQVKWRGYSRAQATWEPRAELMRRCADLVRDYESRLASKQRAPVPAPTQEGAGTQEEAGAAHPSTASAGAARQPNDYESEAMPHVARFVRGRWEYGRLIATPRGKSLRWFQPSAFTLAELESAHFRQLREATAAEQAVVASVVAWAHAQP